MIFGWVILALSGGENLSDLELLAKAKKGDQRSLEQLLESHRESLLRWLTKSWYGKLSTDEIEDAIQDCFQKLCASIDRLEIRSSFKAYLFAAARSECLTILRRTKRHGDEVSIDEIAGEATDESQSSGIAIDGKKYREIPDPNAPNQDQAAMNMDLRAALDKLSVQERLFVKLAFVNQLSTSDISRVTGHSYFTVYRSLQKALPKLKNFLESYNNCKKQGGYGANRVGGNVK